MTVAARQIDHEVWSQTRYLAWLEDQPENSHFEFDGARPVAMAPATVGHNRVGRNIRDAIRHTLPTGTPCDVYGRGHKVFWHEPGDREWRRGTPETGRPIGVPEFGFDLMLVEVYAGIEFD